MLSITFSIRVAKNSLSQFFSHRSSPSIFFRERPSCYARSASARLIYTYPLLISPMYRLCESMWPSRTSSEGLLTSLAPSSISRTWKYTYRCLRCFHLYVTFLQGTIDTVYICFERSSSLPVADRHISVISRTCRTVACSCSQLHARLCKLISDSSTGENKLYVHARQCMSIPHPYPEKECLQSLAIPELHIYHQITNESWALSPPSSANVISFTSLPSFSAGIIRMSAKPAARSR